MFEIIILGNIYLSFEHCSIHIYRFEYDYKGKRKVTTTCT